MSRTWLARELPGEVYGVWVMHHRGRHGLPHGEPQVRPFRSGPGAIETLLARAGPRFLLPLRSADPRATWLDQERVFTSSGAPGTAVLRKQVDCLFFLEIATEPGRRPARPPAEDSR